MIDDRYININFIDYTHSDATFLDYVHMGNFIEQKGSALFNNEDSKYFFDSKYLNDDEILLLSSFVNNREIPQSVFDYIGKHIYNVGSRFSVTHDVSEDVVLQRLKNESFIKHFSAKKSIYDNVFVKVGALRKEYNQLTETSPLHQHSSLGESVAKEFNIEVETLDHVLTGKDPVAFLKEEINRRYIRSFVQQSLWEKVLFNDNLSAEDVETILLSYDKDPFLVMICALMHNYDADEIDMLYSLWEKTHQTCWMTEVIESDKYVRVAFASHKNVSSSLLEKMLDKYSDVQCIHQAILKNSRLGKDRVYEFFDDKSLENSANREIVALNTCIDLDDLQKVYEDESESDVIRFNCFFNDNVPQFMRWVYGW